MPPPARPRSPRPREREAALAAEIAERLEKHRAVRDRLRWKLSETEQTIQELARQEAEDRRRREVARREMGWVLQESRAPEGHPILHRGGCTLRARHGVSPLLDRDGVLAAAEEYPNLEMCDICAPWGSLGITKPAARPQCRATSPDGLPDGFR
ncbi:DUF6233 domain-containing protein [Streptomyces sp. NPDC056501]|uniref:DUF6233 domain-containing protein n=1 Tax=Streptomyces sp. NPDC056501 TaxID=3345841 RepID=UPI00367EADE4